MSDNQHNQPQFYLRRWASNAASKSKQKVWVFDKQIDKTSEELIKDIACADSFFRKDIDQAITGKENHWSRLHERMIEIAATREEFDTHLFDLSEYIAFMFLRTKWMRGYCKESVT
jgi:hypothetical protein